MRFLLTGHTGFVGSYMSLFLREMGHTVSGLALDPIRGEADERGIFELARVGELLEHDLRVDVRDHEAVCRAIQTVKPDFVVHLAAQQLVRESFRQPRATFETNVMGTVNLLEAIASAGVQGALIATTDKVYQNRSQIWGYREDDKLGASDPLSGSKAAADIITQSYSARADYAVPLGIARSANLLGGGDNCKEHLVVDCIAACKECRSVKLRSPNAVRSWQHVLDSISGYYELALRLTRKEPIAEGAFNFGADADSYETVGKVATMIAHEWGDTPDYEFVGDPENIKEEATLSIDSKKAKFYLGWRNRLGLLELVKWTVDWEREVFRGADARTISLAQVREFLKL
ncbi:CDP-glucose 4,6-dehydratase [Campylobacterota bacterium]|nr:CDP-glucose 4,6-dehydratase [Campylobacterota bacterium]